MADESMDKRANGPGGSGAGGGGNGARRPAARRAYRETERFIEKVRDHFTTFFDALYFSRGVGGARGAAARRELAERLRDAAELLPHVIGVLHAEAVDMESEAREDAEREAAEKAEAEKERNEPK